MGTVLMGVIVLGSILLYVWFIFVWLASRIASLLLMPFRRDSDDEVVELGGQVGLGQVVLNKVTRGDRKVRVLNVFLVWPVLAYAHYLFWNPFFAGWQWLFEDVVAPAIATLF